MYVKNSKKWTRFVQKKKQLTRLEKWLTYLCNQASEEEMEEIARQEPAIKKALELEKIFFQNDEERHRYEMREKELHDYESAISSVKQDGIPKEEKK